MDSFQLSSDHSELEQEPILIVGAGGIGCELLKNTILVGFRRIHIVDLDTIDVSNLHRQFLFSTADVGKPKAIVAREAMLKYAPDADITAHFKNVFTFSAAFFRQFKIVFNGLDNIEARSYVNQMCVLGGIPLVETGTAGLLGQSSLIVPGVTECFDCREHPTPITFPICTIRSTPSTMVHCVVWAKEHIFPNFFPSESETGNDIEYVAQENGKVAIQREQAVIQALSKIASPAELSAFVVEKIFGEEIEHIAKLEDVWKAANRAPPTAIFRIDRSHNWVDLLTASINKLRSRKTQVLFDKDDDDTMNCVAALANLRALCFGIEPLPVFEVKSIAGNIIPAISTTNSMIATLSVQHGLSYLRCRDFVSTKTIYVTNTDKLFSHELPSGPNPDCHACGTHRMLVRMPITEPLARIVDSIEGAFPDMDSGDLQIRMGSVIIYDNIDLPDNREKTLRDLHVPNEAVLIADTDSVPVHIVFEASDESKDIQFTRFIQKAKRARLSEPLMAVAALEPASNVIDLDSDSDLEIL